MRVVATAGHVDHGKSSLVRALTGTDPDRFPEEKARGLTIDLGYAFSTLPSGTRVGFVDVPGHVRFVKNMLAGVGAVDVAVLVVAANEGWMPQTEEHTQILSLLDVRHGVVVLSKAALVDADTIAMRSREVHEHIGPWGWPVVAADALDGRGLDDVRSALDAVLAAAPAARDAGRPRLWVDRVFTVRGAGTVVTGTLAGGSLGRNDEVVVVPGDGARATLRARVRGVESAHEPLERAQPGSRVALNLSGVDHGALGRGAAVVFGGQWAVVDTVDVALRPLPGRALARRATVHAHVGSGEQVAQLRVLDAAGRFARLRLAAALPLAPGDRLVLRAAGGDATVAGAEVLDVAPARRTADAVARLVRPAGERVLDARPWCTRAEMEQLAGDAHAAAGCAVELDGWLVAPGALASVRARAHEAVADGWANAGSVAAACGVDVARLRAALADDPDVVVERDVVRSARSGGVLDDPAARALLDALDAARFSPPSPGELGASPALVRALAQAGALVELDGIVFGARAIDDARAIVSGLVLEREAVTLAELRDALGTTRKYALPIVNHLDAEGVTRRRGDLRVPGPRARPGTR